MEGGGQGPGGDTVAPQCGVSHSVAAFFPQNCCTADLIRPLAAILLFALHALDRVKGPYALTRSIVPAFYQAALCNFLPRFCC